MSNNITKSLLNRQTGDPKFSSEYFTAANCCNENLIERFKVERSMKIFEDDFIDDTVCGGWNTNGSLLCVGQYSKGVFIFEPYLENEQKIPILQSSYLTDCAFIPGNKSLLAISTRNYSQDVSNEYADVFVNESLKIWDVNKCKTVKDYSFNGFVYDIIKSQFQPNLLWVSGDPETNSIFEFDCRTSVATKLLLSSNTDLREIFYKSCFDKKPIDETTFIVSEKNKICEYDRRTMSSQSQSKPYKKTKINYGGDSSLIQLKFVPDGKNIIITKSTDFTPKNYMIGPGEIEFEIPEHVDGTITKRFSFLGDSYVLFDTYFENYFLIYDYKNENSKFIGSFSIPNRDESNHNIYSMPNPRYCIIAVVNQGFINYVTPTSF